MAVDLLGDRPERERQTVRRTGQLADSGAKHGGSPGDRAPKNAPLPHDLRDQQLRQTVLKRHDHAVRSKEPLEHSHNRSIIQLLGHKEYGIIFPGHFLLCQSGDRLRELHGSDDLRPFPAKRRHVRLVVVDEVHLPSFFGDERAQNGSKRTRAIDSTSHIHVFMP